MRLELHQDALPSEFITLGAQAIYTGLRVAKSEHGTIGKPEVLPHPDNHVAAFAKEDQATQAAYRIAFQAVLNQFAPILGLYTYYSSGRDIGLNGFHVAKITDDDTLDAHARTREEAVELCLKVNRALLSRCGLIPAIAATKQ